MLLVLGQRPQNIASTAAVSGEAIGALKVVAHAVASASKQIPKIPTWPALVTAAFSILSKEWLYQITKKVGEALNSQILIANAW